MLITVNVRDSVYALRCVLLCTGDDEEDHQLLPRQEDVVLQKGPSGHLRQDPSDEAMRMKTDPSLQDKSPAQLQHHVSTNALTAVLQRGGDVGKSFRWLLENDIGYVIYLVKTVEEEERVGKFNPQGNSKDSLLSFLDYARSFQEVEDLREYLSSRKPASPVASEGDTIVGFGVRAKDTWEQIWKSRADGYAAFILGVKCIKNSKMSNLQQRAEAPSSSLQSPGCVFTNRFFSTRVKGGFGFHQSPPCHYMITTYTDEHPHTTIPPCGCFPVNPSNNPGSEEPQHFAS
ncbi:uncharacterized protein LOC130196317 [Pseudoliparis swirei]|uniref:uncharacterized protein LOC130196317 n=1 Tax=Pseudoliparis swirei TaxID=2059687 RepID=UPI0024BE4C24|nr:uncharacterized protein LOC130196317 [Pseudoliparis swirei]